MILVCSRFYCASKPGQMELLARAFVYSVSASGFKNGKTLGYETPPTRFITSVALIGCTHSRKQFFARIRHRVEPTAGHTGQAARLPNARSLLQ